MARIPFLSKIGPQAGARSPDRGEQFPELDLLRAVASLMILLFHTLSIALRHAEARGIAFPAMPKALFGAIELFFIMSGFLMVHMSFSLYGRKGGPVEFFRRRAMRTPPLYYLYTTLVFIVFLLFPSLQDAPATLLRYLSSLSFLPTGLTPVIAIGWTLTYEVFFYAVILAGIPFGYPRGALISMAILGAFLLLGMALPRVPPWSTWTDFLNVNFILGMTLAMAYYRGVRLPGPIRAVAAIIGVAMVCFNPALSAESRFWFFSLGISLVVGAGVLRPSSGSLSVPSFMKAIGARSYTIYLSHILILKLVEKVYFRIDGLADALFGFVLIGCAAVIAASFPLYTALEQPLTALVRRTFSTRKRSTELAQPGR